jgi:hypothetical protein
VGRGIGPNGHRDGGVLRDTIVLNANPNRLRHGRTNRHTQSSRYQNQNPISHTNSQPDANEHLPTKPYADRNRYLLAYPNPHLAIGYANPYCDTVADSNRRRHYESYPGTNRHPYPYANTNPHWNSYADTNQNS